jgi:hypothetical protein
MRTPKDPDHALVIPGRGRRPSPESITPAGGYGFRTRRHSASKTRVNALAAAPRNDGRYDSNFGNSVLALLEWTNIGVERSAGMTIC